MSLDDLLIALKYGTARSGDWAHRGRPGRVGGSGGGGGIAAGLRLDPKNAKLEDIRSRAAGESAKKRVPLGNRAELLKHYSKHLDNCSDNPCLSVTDYTGSGYRDINRYLRRGDEDYAYYANKRIPNIDEMIETGPRTAKTMRVVRGMGHGNTAKTLANLQPGDEFDDKGFVSTSIKSDLDWSGEAGLTVEIIVPKGSKGLYVEGVSAHKSEQEFLLPRNSKFRIVSMEMKQELQPWQSAGEFPGGKMVVELIQE